MLIFSSADATVMVPLSLDQLAKESDSIVLGHCVGKRAYFSGGMIFTEYTVQVYEVLKGDAVKELKVRQPGGEYDGKGIYIPGVARFSAFEESLIFLGKVQAGSRDVVGWSQGKFHIYYDEQSKTKFAVQEPAGLSVIKKSTGEIVDPAGSKIELEKLVSQVRAVVAKDKDLKK